MIWLAHALTVVRIPLAVAFWLSAADPARAAAVLGVAATTDLLDGSVARLARRRGADPRTADLGAWLDPACDKLFAAVVLVALAVQLGTSWGLIALIGARELVVVPLVIVYRLGPVRRRYRHDFRAAPIGKVTTAAQFVAIAAIVLDAPGRVALAVAAAALGVAAAAEYVARAVHALRDGRGGRVGAAA